MLTGSPSLALALACSSSTRPTSSRRRYVPPPPPLLAQTRRNELTRCPPPTSQLKALLHFYFSLSGDPMMRGVFGLTGHESEWTWFRCARLSPRRRGRAHR